MKSHVLRFILFILSYFICLLLSYIFKTLCDLFTRYQYLKDIETKEFKNPFDRGVVNNCIDFLCGKQAQLRQSTGFASPKHTYSSIKTSTPLEKHLIPHNRIDTSPITSFKNRNQSRSFTSAQWANSCGFVPSSTSTPGSLILVSKNLNEKNPAFDMLSKHESPTANSFDNSWELRRVLSDSASTSQPILIQPSIRTSRSTTFDGSSSDIMTPLITGSSCKTTASTMDHLSTNSTGFKIDSDGSEVHHAKMVHQDSGQELQSWKKITDMSFHPTQESTHENEWSQEYSKSPIHCSVVCHSPREADLKSETMDWANRALIGSTDETEKDDIYLDINEGNQVSDVQSPSHGAIISPPSQEQFNQLKSWRSPRQSHQR